MVEGKISLKIFFQKYFPIIINAGQKEVGKLHSPILDS